MQGDFRFKGGVAVITGAASGIGSGLARKALALGMRVAVADQNRDGLEAFAATLEGEPLVVPTDVRDAAAVDRLRDAAYDRFGRVDLLFNNAGVMATGFSWEIEPERWERTIDVNFYGVLNGIRSFMPRLLESGRPAQIVNTASIGGFIASPLMAPYTMTKFAVVALTESLYGEMQMLKSSVDVSVLAPGPVDTGIFNDPFGAEIKPEIQKFVDYLRHSLSHDGMKPDTFADPVFEAIQNRQFWIIPQPEAYEEHFKQRMNGILEQKNPAPPRF